jgi:hypothetical protein
MGLLDTDPVVIALGTTEVITYAWDTTNYTDASADTAIQDPTFELTDMTVRPVQTISLPDPPTVSGLLVKQILRGADVVAGHTYQALVSFQGVQSGNVMTMRTRMDCPF